MELKISDNIKKLREGRNITQSELAEALSVTPQSVSRWEKGQAYPDIEKLPQLANYFNVSIDALMGNCESRFHTISRELIKVRKKLKDNTPEVRLEYLDLLEQSVNIGSNRFLCEYYNASQKMAKDKIVTDQKYNLVKDTVRKKLMEMTPSERENALTVIVANEDEESLSQWEEFISSDNNRACWHDILQIRYFIRRDNVNFTKQRQEVLFQDISKTLFLINQKSAPEFNNENQLNLHFEESDSLDNCILVKKLIDALSTRDDDIFINLRITAETRLLSTYLNAGLIDNVYLSLKRLKELLLVCKKSVGKKLKGSVNLFANYEVLLEEYKYENDFFEIETILNAEPYVSLKQSDKILSEFARFIEKLHGETDPFCYLPWPARKSFEKLIKQADAYIKNIKAESMCYAFVTETAKGNIYECVVQEDNVKAFVEKLKKNNDTQIKYIVGYLFDAAQKWCLEMPSHKIRTILCDLDKRNLQTEILLQGYGAFIKKTFNNLFGPCYQLKYES